MGKILKYGLVTLLCLFTFSFPKVNAQEEILVMIEGASIRTTGKQGLKFQATYDSSALEFERGFFIVYGEAAIEDIETAVVNNSMVLNGKSIKKATNYNNSSSTISVVLVDIPVNGYNKEITVIAYSINDLGEYTFSKSIVTRSIIEVALNAATSGGSEQLGGLLEEIKANYYRMAFDGFNNYVISSKLFENNFKNLKYEFIKDWNYYFDLSFNALEPDEFFYTAQCGLEDNGPVGESNLYKFFNDEKYGNKWSWLIQFFRNYSSDNLALTTELNALEGDGNQIVETVGNFTYSLTNFFNNANVGYEFTPLDFSSMNNEKYLNILEFNNQIYIKYDNYSFKLAGANIVIPEPTVEEGYEFLGWYNNKDFEGEVITNVAATESTFYPKLLVLNIIDSIAFNVDYKKYTAVVNDDRFNVNIKTDYNIITITINLNEEYILAEDFIVNINNTIIERSKINIDGNTIIYKVDDPNWTKPY